MLTAVVVALLAGGALAFGGGGEFGDRIYARDPNEGIKAPNCSCDGWKPKDPNSPADVGQRHEWMSRFLMPNITLVGMKERFTKQKMICGTDNITYDNICVFTNTAAMNPTLGKRCRGPCPCEFKEKNHTRRGNFSRKSAICLNNGKTVHGWQELKEAIKADASVGSRCFGECAKCATALQCPRRPRHHGGPRRHRRESNTTAPDCTCTLSDSPWFQQFLNTSCGKKFMAKRQICGSDGVTYANKCDFKNNQTKNAALGKRCHGACPCDFESHKKHSAAHFHNESSPHRNSEWHDFFHRKPVCLNNGTTVSSWKEAKEMLKTNNGLGVRCKGDCSECQAEPIKCPLDWVKIKQEEEKSRPKPPNCTCPKSLQMGFGRRGRHEICGNDGKDYANICELVNKQSSQPSLGFRCLGKCPCKNRTEVNDRLPKHLTEESMSEEQDSLEDSAPSAGPSVDETNDIEMKTDEQVSNEEGGDDLVEEEGEAEITENTDREKRDADWEHRRHHRHHRRHHHRRHFSVCLTNGQTVKGWRNVSDAFKSDPNVGIRCRGHCDWCANVTRCPWFPSAEKQEEIRQHHRRMMHEGARKWMEMTMESTEKPGSCDCSFNFSRMNKSEEGRKHWGGHHGHHGKMDWSVCGTNNVTYNNMCHLVNNQSINKHLGFKCHGACPCPMFDIDSEENQEDDNSTESESMKRYMKEHGQKFAFCLTNGTTVYTKKELMAALASKKDLGTRYMDECSVGDAGLKCPRVFRPRNESDKGHGRRRMWGHRGEHPDREEGNEKTKKSDSDKKWGRKEHDALHSKHGWENKTEEERHQYWETMKQSPNFEFEEAHDFGFFPPMGGMEGHHGGKHHAHRRHHEKRDDFCMDEEDEDRKEVPRMRHMKNQKSRAGPAQVHIAADDQI